LKVILLFFILFFIENNKVRAQSVYENFRVHYFGDTIRVDSKIEFPKIDPNKNIAEKDVVAFYKEANKLNFQPLIESILTYKKIHAVDDWLFYQLIRRTAEQLYSKRKKFEYYTIFKWLLLVKCGYNAKLAFINEKLLLYVQSNDNIYDIPLFSLNEKQFVCLNIHDFAKINFKESELIKVDIVVNNATNPFSYKINSIPDFKEKFINEREVFFKYHRRMNIFNITIDEQMEILFNNYPAVDFDFYFNIPVSQKTYNSLIPVLKKAIRKMSQKNGVDYLMQFTRNAFLYETDQRNFGAEKRLSPEQTLMNKYSDCDDRVSLFYYLIKEVYNLPVIVLLYPTHVTIAVELSKPVGDTINYKGRVFTFCEPTPQKDNLPIGKLMPEYKNTEYKIAFEYIPIKNKFFTCENVVQQLQN
jgi:hypothetical protein